MYGPSLLAAASRRAVAVWRGPPALDALQRRPEPDYLEYAVASLPRVGGCVEHRSTVRSSHVALGMPHVRGPVAGHARVPVLPRRLHQRRAPRRRPPGPRDERRRAAGGAPQRLHRGAPPHARPRPPERGAARPHARHGGLREASATVLLRAEAARSGRAASASDESGKSGRSAYHPCNKKGNTKSDPPHPPKILEN